MRNITRKETKLGPGMKEEHKNESMKLVHFTKVSAKYTTTLQHVEFVHFPYFKFGNKMKSPKLHCEIQPPQNPSDLREANSE